MTRDGFGALGLLHSLRMLDLSGSFNLVDSSVKILAANCRCLEVRNDRIDSQIMMVDGVVACFHEPCLQASIKKPPYPKARFIPVPLT